MTDMLDRDELIGLLDRLGSDDDDEVLQAGRQAHAQVAGAGKGWEDLLVPYNPAQEPAEEPAQEPAEEPAQESAEEPAQESAEEPAQESAEEPTEEPAQEPAEEPAEEPADESDETGEPASEVVEDEPPGAGGDKNAESLALIGELLARSDISEELRAELKGYKADIAEGDFLEADRKYLRAVRQRLKK